MENSFVENQTLKIILINLSHCIYYKTLLQSYSEIKSITILNEEVPENERISVQIGDLEFEKKLLKFLTYFSEENVLNINFDGDVNLNNFILEIRNHRLFKFSTGHISFSFIWTYFVHFLIKQWDVKMKRIILKHFNALDYIEHLSDVERRQIKYLGRAAQTLNPHLNLLGKMVSIVDDFSTNERECKTFDFFLLNLSLSTLRCRFDKAAVSELISDYFSYRLQPKRKLKNDSDEFVCNSTIYSSNIPTCFHQEVVINKNLNSTFALKPIFGFKNEIMAYPFMLTICIDRYLQMPLLDGSSVIVYSQKILKFASTLMAEDFKDQMSDDNFKFKLIAVQISKGTFYVRYKSDVDDGWLKFHSKKIKKISTEQFNATFRKQQVSVLIYNRESD